MRYTNQHFTYLLSYYHCSSETELSGQSMNVSDKGSMVVKYRVYRLQCQCCLVLCVDASVLQVSLLSHSDSVSVLSGVVCRR